MSPRESRTTVNKLRLQAANCEDEKLEGKKESLVVQIPYAFLSAIPHGVSDADQMKNVMAVKVGHSPSLKRPQLSCLQCIVWR